MSEEKDAVYQQHIFLKARFQSSSQNLYGLILINFNPTGDVDNYHIVASTFSDMYEDSENAEWFTYEDTIIQAKWKNKYNTSITRDLQLQLETMFEDSFQKTHLFEAADDYDYNTVQELLKDATHRIIQDKNLKIEVNIQEATVEEINTFRQDRETERQKKYATEKTTGFNLEDGAVLLGGSLVLAPVNGKALYELKVGEQIMVKIDSGSAKSQSYITLYNLKKGNGAHHPIPAEVIDIQAASINEPVQILTRVEDSIYIKLVEEERQVKLRLFNAATDKSAQAMKAATHNAVASVTTRKQYGSEGSNRGGSGGISIILAISLSLILFLFIVGIYFFLFT